jgi:hypothetical protein
VDADGYPSYSYSVVSRKTSHFWGYAFSPHAAGAD